MWRSGFHKSRDMCFCLFLDGLHFIGSDCDGETPVDECYRGEERYHHHVAHPTCFEEEEADEAEEYAIDDAKPPVSGAASGACGYECLNAPENEDNGKEIGNTISESMTLRTSMKPMNMSITPPAIHQPQPLGRSGPAATHSCTTPASTSSQPKSARRRHSPSGPEPICKATEYKQYAHQKHNPPPAGLSDCVQFDRFHFKCSLKVCKF